MDKYFHAIANRRFIRHYGIAIGMLLWGANAACARPLNTSRGIPSIRHVQGVKNIGIHAGFASMGKALSIDHSYHFAPHWQIKVGLGAEVDKLKNNAYRSIFTQPVFGYMLYSNHKHWFFTVLGGAKFHVEYHRPKKKDKEKSTHSGNIGLVVGGETELFLVKNVSLALSGGLRMFLLKSPYGRTDYFLNMGLKIGF